MRKIKIALEITSNRPKSLRARLEQKFKRGKTNNCWLWTGATNPKGYGYIMVDHMVILAHRLNWFFSHGNIPFGMCVCHKCDNPLCVNPKHLFLGTKKDNAQDAQNKGRLIQHRGSYHANAKLNEIQVAKIKKLLARGVKGTALAKRFRVTKSTVSSIKLGVTWSHVTTC